MRDLLKAAAKWVGIETISRSIEGRLRGVKRLLLPAPYPIYNNKNIAPFFIVGSGRCGTTLLRRILQAHSEVHIPPENSNLVYAKNLFLKYRWVLDWEEICYIVLSVIVQTNDGKEQWFEELPVSLLQCLRDVPQRERSFARVIDTIYTHHAEIVGASFVRWGDKTPTNVQHMEQLLSIYPDARFVHLLRDGADVSYSWLRYKNYEDILIPARRWKEAVEATQDFDRKYPGRMLEIKYEKLVTDTIDVVKGVCDFLGISYEVSMLEGSSQEQLRDVRGMDHHENLFDNVSDRSVGNGRKRISKSDMERMEELIGHLIIRKGYEPL